MILQHLIHENMPDIYRRGHNLISLYLCFPVLNFYKSMIFMIIVVSSQPEDGALNGFVWINFASQY